MFRPQIQKTKVMLSLAILIMVMVYWSVNSYVKKPTYGYDIKKRAIKLMIESIEEIIHKLRIKVRQELRRRFEVGS